MRSRTKLLLGCLAIVFLFSGSLLSYKYILHKPPYRLPKTLAEQVNQPYYLPRVKTAGLSVDESSYSYTNGSLSYVVTDTSNNKYFVVEQKKPVALNLTAFNQRITDSREIETRIGNAVVGTINETPEDAPAAVRQAAKVYVLGNVITKDNIWVLISTVGKENLDTIAQILQSL